MMRLTELPEDRTTLRWLIDHRWGHELSQPAAQEIIDRIVGFPVPGRASTLPLAAEPEAAVDGTDGRNDEAAAPRPVVAEPVSGGRRKVALIVGHNSRAQGAWTLPPVGLSEFAYYSQMTQRLVAIAETEARDMEFRVFHRQPAAHYAAEIDAAYAPVNAWRPDLAMELHFNGGGGNYAMMLAARGSERGVHAAVAILRTMSAGLGIPVWSGGSPRGVSQVARGDRGGRSVWAARAPAVLTEPWFGDHSLHAQRVAEMGMHDMARLHIEAAREALAAIA